MARPSSYNENTADIILQGIADGKSLKTICKGEKMPSVTTVFNWLADEKYKSFLERYTRAKADQAESMFERITEITELVREKELDPNAARVMIDAIKWQAGKLKPNKYSDKYVHEISGPDGGPIEYTDTERAARLAAIAEQARRRSETQDG